jgi:hypothetical protein
MNPDFMPTRRSMGCSIEQSQPDEPPKLDAEELAEIEFLTERNMSGRVTRFEILELVRVYRKALNKAASE